MEDGRLLDGVVVRQLSRTRRRWSLLALGLGVATQQIVV